MNSLSRETSLNEIMPQFAEPASPEFEPINNNPTFVYLDIDQTVLFDKKTREDRISFRRRITELNRAAKVFNLVFIPTTQRTAAQILDNDSIYSEVQNLKWYPDGKECPCPLFLCEMGGIALIKDGERHEEIITSTELQKYANNQRPGILDTVKSLFGDAISFELGTRLLIGVELSDSAVEIYGTGTLAGNKRKVAKNNMAKKLKNEFSKQDSSIINDEGLFTAIIMTGGEDLDILPLELAQGKEHAVNVSLQDLLLNPLLAIIASENPGIKKLFETHNKKSSVIIDDKGDVALAAAQNIVDSGGGVLASAVADKKLESLAKKFGGSKPRNTRITQLISELAYLINNKKEVKNIANIITIGEDAHKLVEQVKEEKIRIKNPQLLNRRVERYTYFSQNDAKRDLLPEIERQPEKFIGSNMIIYVNNNDIKAFKSNIDFLKKISKIYQRKKIGMPQFKIFFITEDASIEDKFRKEKNELVKRLARSANGFKINFGVYPGPNAPHSNGVIDHLDGIIFDSYVNAEEQT